MRRIFSFLMGMIIGGLVGGTVGILLAPTSGEDVRSRIQERTTHFKDEIKAVAEARRAELERELAALRAPYRKE